MTDFLAEKRKEIKARMDELRPLVDEYNRLEAAERALAGVDGGASSTTRAPARRARGTARAAAPKKASTGRRGRPKGSGTRGAQALEIVRAHPGVTIPEMAEQMGIKQNYLYRVMPDLAEQGLVTKSGRGWHVRQ